MSSEAVVWQLSPSEVGRLMITCRALAETVRPRGNPAWTWLRTYVQRNGWWRAGVAAAQAGQLEALSIVRAQGCSVGTRAVHAAAKCGEVEVLRWLRTQELPRQALQESLRLVEPSQCDFTPRLCV